LSEKANVDYQTCVENRNQCPITDIQFSSTLRTGYANAGVVFGKYVLYSKNVANYPIVETHAGLQPCADSSNVQTARAATFYPLEVQQANSCPIESWTGSTVDKRWRYTGVQTNEYLV
jgi:hypothetical protein